MNWLTDDLKNEIIQNHKNIFDTWKRGDKIRFYKKAKEVFVYNPQYMSDFDEQAGNSNLKTEDYVDYDVCLTFLDRQELSNFLPGEDTNVRFKAINSRIKVQVEASAFEDLKAAERFTFQGEKYALEAPWRGLGMFDQFQFFEVILMRVP